MPTRAMRMRTSRGPRFSGSSISRNDRRSFSSSTSAFITPLDDESNYLARLPYKDASSAVDLAVSGGIDDGQLGRRGEPLDLAVAQEHRVLGFTAADAGVPCKGLVVDNGLGSRGSGDPFAFTVTCGPALMMELLFAGETFGGIGCLRNLEEFRRCCAHAGCIEKSCVDLCRGTEAGREFRRQFAEMNEAGDGDGEAPLACAEIQHGVLLEARAAGRCVLVLEDATVYREEIDRGQNAAAQQAGCSDGLKVVFAEAGLDLVQRFDGGGCDFRAQRAVAGYLGFAE